MSSPFRLNLQRLEDRDVPASFSAQFADGTTVFGQFDTPPGVDPTQASQTVSVTDVLTVTRGGEAFIVDDAYAAYAYGVQYGMGVVAHGAVSGDYLYVLDSTALAPGQSATAVYDTAETRATFTLPDGAAGSLSYTIPADQVDSTQASQSLALSTFNLNVAGRNFAYGSASYTTAPTLNFEYGNLVGFSFALDTSAVAGFRYTSVSVAGGIVTAIDAATSLPLSAPYALDNATVMLDFSTITIPANTQGDQELKFRVTAADGTVKLVTVTMKPTDTKTQVRDKFAAALTAAGFKGTADGNTRLEVGGKTGANPSELTKVESFNFGYTGSHPKFLYATPDPNGTKPTYTTTT